MRRVAKLLFCLFILPLLFAMPGSLRAIDNQEWTPSGSGGTCAYCSQPLCGCSSSSTRVLNYECSCSPIQCYRACYYA